MTVTTKKEAIALTVRMRRRPRLRASLSVVNPALLSAYERGRTEGAESGYERGHAAGAAAGHENGVGDGHADGVGAAWRAVAMMISNGALEVSTAQAIRISKTFSALARGEAMAFPAPREKLPVVRRWPRWSWSVREKVVNVWLTVSVLGNVFAILYYGAKLWWGGR